MQQLYKDSHLGSLTAVGFKYKTATPSRRYVYIDYFTLYDS